MRLIKLTGATYGDPIFINPVHIVCMSQPIANGKPLPGTKVWTVDDKDNPIMVAESLEDVAMIVVHGGC